MGNTRLQKLLADFTESVKPVRRVTILSPRQVDCPQKGQIISSEDGMTYCVRDCNNTAIRLTCVETGEKILVSATKVIVINDNSGKHWHLQRTNERTFTLSNTQKDQVLSAEKANQLKVLVDDAGHKLAVRMYKQFVSDEDMANMPQFVIDLDDLLCKYRGDKPITEDEVDELADDLENEDEYSGKEEKKPKKKSKKESTEEDDDSDFDDEEEDKEESSFKLALAAKLLGSK